MDSKTKWLIAGFVYMLGVVGLFIVTFVDARTHAGSDAVAAQMAMVAGLLWPIEVVKLLFKIF